MFYAVGTLGAIPFWVSFCECLDHSTMIASKVVDTMQSLVGLKDTY